VPPQTCIVPESDSNLDDIFPSFYYPLGPCSESHATEIENTRPNDSKSILIFPLHFPPPTMSDFLDEKRKQAHPLDLQDEAGQLPQTRLDRLNRLRRRCAFALLVALAVGLLWHPTRPLHPAASLDLLEEDICPQVEPLIIEPHSTPATPPPAILAHLLSGAVQVNTSVYDDYPLPVSSSPQVWRDTFAPFRDYLKRAFPAVHASDKIQLELVNENGLLYTWKGSNSSLKPIVFMAHQGESRPTRWANPGSRC
jgi:hypothetical protein